MAHHRLTNARKRILDRSAQPFSKRVGLNGRWTRRMAKFDKASYRNRNILERLIGWLKECRAVLARFEKTAINYAGMVKMAMIQRYRRVKEAWVILASGSAEWGRPSHLAVALAWVQPVSGRCNGEAEGAHQSSLLGGQYFLRKHDTQRLH